jgi:glycosyltransferase involved in cell wall biosynthesis
MSRFPRITETFVLYEMLALRELGIDVEVFPLIRTREAVVHPEAAALVERAHYRPWLSRSILAAQGHYLRRAPLTYLGTLAAALGRTLGSPRYLAGALAFFPKAVLFAREMEALGVTHVHAHFANHPALVGLIVQRLTGIPFSFTAHGSDLHVDQTALDWKLSEAAFAVTVSRYNRRFVCERLGDHAAQRLHVVHCGVDPEALPARAAEPPGPPGPPLEILCVAALRAVKGHRHLIEACRLLAAAGVPFRLHLVGGGPLQRDVEAHLARFGLEERAVLHGPLPRAEVLHRMRSAHVLVLPSVLDRQGRREGIPVTLMEAMSTGLPVVASRISGIPELVEDGVSGLLVPPGDPPALASALERLAADPGLRERLARAARARVRARFDLREGARQLVRLVLDAGGEASRAPGRRDGAEARALPLQGAGNPAGSPEGCAR